MSTSVIDGLLFDRRQRANGYLLQSIHEFARKLRTPLTWVDQNQFSLLPLQQRLIYLNHKQTGIRRVIPVFRHQLTNHD